MCNPQHAAPSFSDVCYIVICHICHLDQSVIHDRDPSLWLFPKLYLEQTWRLYSKIESPESHAVTAQLQFQTA